MDVFKFAMQMEKDGQAFYEKMATQAENGVVKSILAELAEDEVKHYNIFKKLSEGDFSATNELKGSMTNVLANAQNIFEKLATEKPEMTFSSDVKATWLEAQTIEKKSEDYYREKAQEADSDEVKGLLFLIADEEHKHWSLIENVINFLDQPTQWLENAEWNKLDNC